MSPCTATSSHFPRVGATDWSLCAPDFTPVDVRFSDNRYVIADPTAALWGMATNL